MRCDYKFWYIRRDDDGVIQEAAVRFFLGDINTQEEYGKQVTRYRRFARVPPVVLGSLGMTLVPDGDNEVALFNPTHFGLIKTDDELRVFCNSQLARLPGHQPIDEQT